MRIAEEKEKNCRKLKQKNGSKTKRRWVLLQAVLTNLP
jgi:hypothetical protein